MKKQEEKMWAIVRIVLFVGLFVLLEEIGGVLGICHHRDNRFNRERDIFRQMVKPLRGIVETHEKNFSLSHLF